jgi:hypothetical protein
MTIQEFATKHEITITYNRLEARPDCESTDWHKGAFHFRCLLKKGKSSYEVTYSMGPGHGEKFYDDRRGRWDVKPPKPGLPDVLDSLRMDAQSVDDAGDFPEWAGNYGHDIDSRKAYATWEACKEAARKLRHFLGSAAYDELMTCDSM